MRPRPGFTLLWILALALVACSDDSAQPPKGDAPTSSLDRSIGTDRPASGSDGLKSDQSGTADKAQGGADKAQGGDGTGAAPVLSSSHQGWGQPNCATSGCHNPIPPPPPHPTAPTKPADCAQCHGGNGACNPNGPNSGKQNHTQSLNCLNCHSGHHGGIFTANTDCVACHFAAKGTQDCPQ